MSLSSIIDNYVVAPQRAATIQNHVEVVRTREVDGNEVLSYLPLSVTTGVICGDARLCSRATSRLRIQYLAVGEIRGDGVLRCVDGKSLTRQC